MKSVADARFDVEVALNDLQAAQREERKRAIFDAALIGFYLGAFYIIVTSKKGGPQNENPQSGRGEVTTA